MEELDPLSLEFIAFANEILDSTKELQEIIKQVKQEDVLFYSTMSKKWLKEAANDKMTLGAIEHGPRMLLNDFSDDQLKEEIVKENLDKILYTIMRRFKKFKKHL